ncbi:S-adenosyl-L-methionine-dependent methyltransferase, MraW [Corchorus olitorius]|uniref:S-adenosyl-L-methionine-dependent methyltransferase, MraW n=1 Tax=Corchorus olitorius TaxID=93759 RepID=A0A1R3J8E5_9ROSI|nr:S-adenosyl-L-methionine-dependent methyltransferase, MraW [Corchorus olitorius]
MAAKAKQMMQMTLSPFLSFSAASSLSTLLPVSHPSKSRALLISACRSISTNTDTNKKKKKSKESKIWHSKSKGLAKEKRRTRSLRDCDIEIEEKEVNNDSCAHIPVMLGEVLDVFSPNSKPLCSFVDCTLGAAGHASAVSLSLSLFLSTLSMGSSSIKFLLLTNSNWYNNFQIIQAHPQLKVFIGMDVDPLALQLARSRIHALSQSPHFQAFTFLKNYRHIKSLLSQVDRPDILSSGVDGILMDLGMSSMQVNNPNRGFAVLANGPLDMRMDPQASLKAEDILNSWPDSEVGRILRDYGEESNWRFLQNKIVQARLQGGLHSTGELVDVIRSASPASRGGRQGWVKTATRVFQALRIAVNDELRTLEDSLYACFDCLAPGGRLAVISFHSLEDRIVKQTFLKLVDCIENGGDVSVEESEIRDLKRIKSEDSGKELWIRQTIQGSNGIILTKRPITPSEKEEGLNRRSRSAKLRVIQKV